MKLPTVYFRSKQGLTILELIIASAIALIVIAVSFNMFFFGNKSFSIGSTQSYVQSDVRIVSDYIQRNIRFATQLDTIAGGDVPSVGDTIADSEEPYNYIYFDNGEIRHLVLNDSNTYVTQYRTDLSVDNVEFSGNDKKLIFEVHGTENEQNYSLQSDILLPNLWISSDDIMVGGLDNQSAIKYLPPDSTAYAGIDDDSNGGTPGNGGNTDEDNGAEISEGLNNLNLNMGNLEPSFSSDTFNYDLNSNSFNGNNIRITAYATNGIIRINGTVYNSGQETGNINTNTINPIVITVTEEDKEPKTYIITIY